MHATWSTCSKAADDRERNLAQQTIYNIYTVVAVLFYALSGTPTSRSRTPSRSWASGSKSTRDAAASCGGGVSKPRTNRLADARKAGNADKARALAARLQVWGDPRSGNYYLVDEQTRQAHGPLVPSEISRQRAEAGRCWSDEFLDLHWRFLELPLQALPADTQGWRVVPEDEWP